MKQQITICGEDPPLIHESSRSIRRVSERPGVKDYPELCRSDVFILFQGSHDAGIGGGVYQKFECENANMIR